MNPKHIKYILGTVAVLLAVIGFLFVEDLINGSRSDRCYFKDQDSLHKYLEEYYEESGVW